MERKSKEKIIRFIDLIYRLFNIMLGSIGLFFHQWEAKNILIYKLNKRLNTFYFYSAKYWKGKIRSRLNDTFVVSIDFLFFLDLISILFFLF